MDMIVILLIALGFILLAIWIGGTFVIVKKIYKNDFIGIRVVDGAKIMYRSRAREVTDDEGITYWKLLKRWMLPKQKSRIAAPKQTNTIYKGGTGVLSIGFINENDEVTWANLNDDDKQLQYYVDPMLRASYKHQAKKAAAERGQSIFMGVVNNMAIIALVVIVMVLIFVGGDAAKSMNEVYKDVYSQQETIHDRQVEIFDMLNTQCFASQGIQVIGGLERNRNSSNDNNET